MLDFFIFLAFLYFFPLEHTTIHVTWGDGWLLVTRIDFENPIRQDNVLIKFKFNISVLVDSEIIK